jgi:hypothetical protein
MDENNVKKITIYEIKELIHQIFNGYIDKYHSPDNPEIWKRIHEEIAIKYKAESFQLSPRTVCVIRVILQEYIRKFYDAELAKDSMRAEREKANSFKLLTEEAKSKPFKEKLKEYEKQEEATQLMREEMDKKELERVERERLDRIQKERDDFLPKNKTFVNNKI